MRLIVTHGTSRGNMRLACLSGTVCAVTLGGVIGCGPPAPPPPSSPGTSFSSTSESVGTPPRPPALPSFIAAGAGQSGEGQLGVNAPSEQELRLAIERVVDAERRLRESIRDVSDGPSAQQARPALESGCQQLVAAWIDLRQRFEAASADLPLMQLRVDLDQALHDLGQDLPDRPIDKMKIDSVVMVWGDSQALRDMIASVGACREALMVKTGGTSTSQMREEAEANAVRGREESSRWIGRNRQTPVAPGVPPGVFPPGMARPSVGVAPLSSDERPKLDGPPRPNVVVVMRGADGSWVPVLVRELLPNGQVKVNVMNRVNGRLVPGQEQTVDAAALYHAIPQRDL